MSHLRFGKDEVETLGQICSFNKRPRTIGHGLALEPTSRQDHVIRLGFDIENDVALGVADVQEIVHRFHRGELDLAVTHHEFCRLRSHHDLRRRPGFHGFFRLDFLLRELLFLRFLGSHLREVVGNAGNQGP